MDLMQLNNVAFISEMFHGSEDQISESDIKTFAELIKDTRKEDNILTRVNDTHMEEFVFYWKNSPKYKVVCFWHFSYVYTII